MSRRGEIAAGMLEVEENMILRAKVARLTAERDQTKAWADKWAAKAAEVTAMAEEALRQRDEACEALKLAREALTEGKQCDLDQKACVACVPCTHHEAIAAIELCLK